jgi:hypothetical protein
MGDENCPPPDVPVVSEIDPVELALATALERASAAAQWASVEVLARELESRRKQRRRCATRQRAPEARAVTSGGMAIDGEPAHDTPRSWKKTFE